MIEKVVSIENLGIFRKAVAKGDVSFRKLTLLFAENGCGKTTLCSILRSLKTGESKYISERKALGSTSSSSVNLRINGKTTKYENNSWSDTAPDIAIFDSVFVHDNVYAGDFVLHEHKKNLYRVIIGQNGVSLAKRIDELDDEIREINSLITEKREILSRTIPSGISCESFVALQPEEDIEHKIKHKTEELDNRKRAKERADEILSKDQLSEITLPAYPLDIVDTLSKQLSDIISDAGEQVIKHIKVHNMGDKGETWLSQGVDFIVEEKCPFCGQKIDENELIGCYRSHFNASYKELKERVSHLPSLIDSSIGESVLNRTQRTFSKNLVLIEFWKQFIDIDELGLTIEDVLELYKILRSILLELADRKNKLPTESVKIPEELYEIVSSLESLSKSVEEINEKIKRTNELIKQKKSET